MHIPAAAAAHNKQTPIIKSACRKTYIYIRIGALQNINAQHLAKTIPKAQSLSCATTTCSSNAKPPHPIYIGNVTIAAERL